MSNLGFRTLKEAIWALDDGGIAPKDIAERLGCKTASVYARLAEKRKHAKTMGDWSDEKKARAFRIHAAALGVIAEALEVSVESLRAVLMETPPAKEEDADPDPSSAGDDEEAPDQPINGQDGNSDDLAPPRDKTEPPPPEHEETQSQQRKGRVYGLRSMDGKWMTRNGKGFTDVEAEAWSGTAEEAKAARQRLPCAKFCKAKEFASA